MSQEPRRRITGLEDFASSIDHFPSNINVGVLFCPLEGNTGTRYLFVWNWTINRFVFKFFNASMDFSTIFWTEISNHQEFAITHNLNYSTVESKMGGLFSRSDAKLIRYSTSSSAVVSLEFQASKIDKIAIRKYIIQSIYECDSNYHSIIGADICKDCELRQKEKLKKINREVGKIQMQVDAAEYADIPSCALLMLKDRIEEIKKKKEYLAFHPIKCHFCKQKLQLRASSAMISELLKQFELWMAYLSNLLNV